ncbi:hypothetical protein LCGC14_1914630 [marine sediment metagenome]|uniref:N-acetyltransferase domain-containing protein n=1 Tax=marine sediment metagenome TaxID=412755 RepID=A0A0F9FT93_9ZZZZ
MNDADFIIGLMKTETDALGFIPSTAIRSRWIAKGRFIIQRDRRGRRRGYLLHGPANPGRELYVNQICIEYDHRLKGHALMAIDELIGRGRRGRCTQINLRCAANLSANWFWLATGFHLVTAELGGQRRNRRILVYRYPLNIPDRQTPTPHLYRIPGVSKVG